MRVPKRFAGKLTPPIALGAILVAQLLGVVAIAAAANHDGWLWYQGGDQLWHWAGAWLLSDGWFPPAEVGYVWSLLLAPVAALAGPNFLVAVPAFVLLQPLLLVPAATGLVYAAGARLAGRWFGICAAAVWALAPLLAIPLFVDRYHDRWIDLFLPQLMGLSGLADLPATVCVLAAAVATLRALDRPIAFEGALAGVATGIAVGLKPSNALFLAAPLAALAVARAWRPAVAFVAALAPFVLLLTVWKVQGMGEIPAFAAPAPVSLAAPAEMPLALGNPVDRYIDLDWSQLDHNLDQLREFFWSARLLEWVPIAGTLALFRLSAAKALLVSLWFWAFLIAKGTSTLATVESGSFWRLLMPALPAYALLVTALLLLVPTLGGRIAATASPAPRALPRRLLAGAGAAIVVVSLLVFVLLRPLDGPRAIQLQEEGTLVPVVEELRLDAAREGEQLVLTWSQPETRGSKPFYRLFYYDADELSCFDAGVRQCILYGNPTDTIEGTRHIVPFRPGIYRIGMVANWKREKGLGETLLLGPQLVVPG